MGSKLRSCYIQIRVITDNAVVRCRCSSFSIDNTCILCLNIVLHVIISKLNNVVLISGDVSKMQEDCKQSRPDQTVPSGAV